MQLVVAQGLGTIHGAELIPSPLELQLVFFGFTSDTFKNQSKGLWRKICEILSWCSPIVLSAAFFATVTNRLFKNE